MRKEKTAVITGATSGIGSVFARTLAQQGWNLLITGRRKDRLFELKEELTHCYGVNVITVSVDFTLNEELEYFLEVLKYQPTIELLINNAGFGSIGNYFKSNYHTQQQMLHVHITATTRIIHQVVPQMIKRNHGAIINVSSLSAFFPGPNSYFYCSTKAFLVTFSECLNIDLAKSNIQVQALCPGFTHTEFHSRQGVTQFDSYIKELLLWKTPQQVVDKSLKSLSKKSVICIPGFFNRFLYRISHILPKKYYYMIADKNSDTFLNTPEETKKTVEEFV